MRRPSGALEEERTVGLADPDQARVGRQLDDHLAHPADRVGGRADRLRQRRRQEVGVERGDLHQTMPRVARSAIWSLV